MKSWKEIYEDYKVAVQKKGNKEQKDRMIALAQKMENEAYNVVWKGCCDRLSHGSAVWHDENFEIKGWAFSHSFGTWKMREIYGKSIFEVMDYFSRFMLHEYGTMIMNRHENVSLDEAKSILADIEASSRKIDSDFIADIMAREKRGKELLDRSRAIREAVEDRWLKPNRLWYQMVKDWAEQELFVVGKEILGYGVVNKVSESFIFCTTSWGNTYKKKKENFYDGFIFERMNPEYKKLH